MSLSLAALILIDCAMMCRRSSNSPEVGIKDAAMRRKYIFLPFLAKEHSRESVGTAERSVDTKLPNAICTSKGGSIENGGSNKTCNFCGVKGHKEAQCFKNFPERAPTLWWKEKNAKTKLASLNVVDIICQSHETRSRRDLTPSERR
jgi:hypothetical protein